MQVLGSGDRPGVLGTGSLHCSCGSEAEPGQPSSTSVRSLESGGIAWLEICIHTPLPKKM